MSAYPDPVSGCRLADAPTRADLLVENDWLRAEVAALTERLRVAEHAADRDPLADVFNRRAFLRALARVQAYLARYGGESAVLFFDLDGLKGVNDAHGHAAGDLAIQSVADLFLANVRESDVVARIGGDEFAVLLSHVSHDEAQSKGDALAAAVADYRLAYGGAEIRLSISWGLRMLEPEVDPLSALADADAAMYLAKEARAAAPV